MDEMKIFEKLDKLEGIANKQEVNLAKLTVSVEEHVKRSNMMEDEQKEIRKEIEPIKAHVSKVEGAVKLLAALATIAGLVLTYLKLISK